MVTWIKPFLAPLFAWTSVLARGTVTRVPTLVFISLRFLRRQIQHHGHWVNVLAPWQSPSEAFRTDAKCEDGRIVLAGWSLEAGVEDLKRSSWFCLEVYLTDLPMFFKEDGSPQWCSTAAETHGIVRSCVRFRLFEGRETGEEFEIGHHWRD